MTDLPYNDGHTHEALHTTYILMSAFEDHVLDTCCSDHFSDVQEAANGAHEALFYLYQLIGSKMP